MGRADRGASIAPTALWCPYGSRPTVRAPPPPLPRRSCQDSSLANSPRGERLRSEGTENALKAHLERAAVDAGGRVSRPESNRDSRAPKPPGLAARSPPAAPRSAHSVLSEIFGNIAFGCRDEAKRGEEGASKVSSGCPRVRSTTTCDLIMESPAWRPSWRSETDPPAPSPTYARQPPPEVPPAPSHRIALCIRSARLSSSLSSKTTLPRSSRPPALDDHDCLPPRPPRRALTSWGLILLQLLPRHFHFFVLFYPQQQRNSIESCSPNRLSRGGKHEKKSFSLTSRNEEPP